MLGALGKLIGSTLGLVLGRISVDKDMVAQGQQRANEAEISGAPVSPLRLWRGFLGWVLSLLFVWEVVGRSIITTYWPDVKLPPSVLEEIGSLLMGMLGMGA